MKERVVYFLDLDGDKAFSTKIAWEMRRHKIIIIPTKRKNLKNLLRGKGNILFTFARSMDDQSKLDELKSSYLNLSMINKKITFIEFNSFEKMGKKSKFMNQHFQYVLPMSFSKISRTIADHVDDFYQVDRLWPGGNRARLTIEM